MLSYKAPFLQSGNLTIFKDDSSPDTFYYVSVQPNIERDESGRPKFEAYAILPVSGTSDGTGGIMESSLAMDISLEPSPDELKDAIEAIQKNFGQKPKVFVPAPVIDGKVYLIIAAAGDQPKPDKWFITSAVSPSIFGSNRASLVARATGQDATNLIAALDADVIAASVHYELSILGIAPVYKANMKVHWDMVYHHFDQYDKTNYLFYTDELSSSIDQLKETKAIEVHVDELDPDVKDSAMESLFNELKTQVVQNLFKPASPTGEKFEDRLATGVSKVLSSLIPGVHHVRKSLDEVQLGEATIDLSQSNAKKYSFYPQSLLSSMVRAVGGSKDLITWVKLDDIPFIDQKVHLNLTPDTFASSNIKTVVVTYRIREQATGKEIKREDIVLDKNSPLQNSVSFLRDKEKVYIYDYKMSIVLSNDANLLADKLDIDWQTVEGPYYYISLGQFFEKHELTVSLNDTNVFTYVRLIQSEIRVLDRNTGALLFSTQFLFTADKHDRQLVSLLSQKDKSVQLDMDLTYFINDAQPHTTSLKDVKEGLFFIPNTFASKWSVDIVCNANWQNTLKLKLETRIKDVQRDDLIVHIFDFSAQHTSDSLGVATSLDTPTETFEYQVTILGADNNVVIGPWTRHTGLILSLNDKIHAERIIILRLSKAPDFTEKEIKKVSVELMYDDNNNNIHLVSDRLELKAVGDTVQWKHAMPDFNKKEYSYRIRVNGKGGQLFKTDWIKSNKEAVDLVVPQDVW